MTRAEPQASEADRVDPARVVREGLVAGVLGAVVVAVVHYIADAMAGEPLRTPTVLGLLFTEGAAAARTAQGSLAVALEFTGFHVVIWLVLGTIGAWLISLVDAHPRLASFVFAGFAFVFITVLYAAGAFSLPGMPLMHLWSGTLLGSVAAAGYLVWRHPRLADHILRERLTETTRRQLERALEHEAADLAAYHAIASQFPTPIFQKMIDEKRTRSVRLRAHCESLGLPASESPEVPHAWRAGTLDEALREALEFEHATLDFYDRFLAAVPELSVRDLFLRLRFEVLDTTIPELERALEGKP